MRGKHERFDRTFELVERFRPDLILLDLQMPHIDGLQVLETLRAGEADDDQIPVLVLTANPSTEAVDWQLGSA